MNEKNKVSHKRLKELRKQMGLTQQQVASMINVAQSTYSDYENGELNIHSELWLTFAYIYGVSVDYMMGLTEDPTRYWGNDSLSVAEQLDDSNDEKDN